MTQVVLLNLLTVLKLMTLYELHHLVTGYQLIDCLLKLQYRNLPRATDFSSLPLASDPYISNFQILISALSKLIVPSS
jgi:hypothetical protein